MRRNSIFALFVIGWLAWSSTAIVSPATIPDKRDRADDSGRRLHTPSPPFEVTMSRNDPSINESRPGKSPSLVLVALDAPDSVLASFSEPLSQQAASTLPFELVGPGGLRAIREVRLESSDRKGAGVTLRIDPITEKDYPSFNRGEWSLSCGAHGTQPVWLGKILDSADFRFEGEMGLIREGAAAILRVFAPTAHSVTWLLFRSSPPSPSSEIPMERKGHGLWEARCMDLDRYRCYRVRVQKRGRTFEGVEPYSKANTAHDGYSLIFSDRTPISRGPVFDNAANIIYELHLRDMTIHPKSGVKHKGKYLGLAESPPRHVDHPDVMTGLDHLVELGVNTIQIMPIADFAHDEHSDSYNWGYMPVHFNSPDGWYATRTDTQARVTELKTLIDALHRKGMKVVLDVVHNHTAEGSQDIAFGFNAMTDSYYYRQKPDGTYYNGSGCGNEFRSESPMGRKVIIDSLKYWLDEYKVDGFRFDLMGLIDFETIRLAVRELRKQKPDVVIYGEPWTCGETPIQKIQKGSQRSQGFAVFNDNFRDALKGSIFDLSPGYVQAGVNREAVKKGIAGSIIDDFADSPLETINYVSCHDNYTLWDRIVLTTKDTATASQRRAMNKLAAGIILTSQGIPFIHSGEEILRTKGQEDNSYNKPDSVNRIDWDQKPVHRDIFDYYRDLIALRKAHPAFRMTTSRDIRANLRFYEELRLDSPGAGIGYTLDGAAAGDPWKRIVVLVNPSRQAAVFPLPPGSFFVAADQTGVLPDKGPSVSGSCRAAPISLTVLYQP